MPSGRQHQSLAGAKKGVTFQLTATTSCCYQAWLPTALHQPRPRLSTPALLYHRPGVLHMACAVWGTGCTWPAGPLNYYLS